MYPETPIGKTNKQFVFIFRFVKQHLQHQDSGYDAPVLRLLTLLAATEPKSSTISTNPGLSDFFTPKPLRDSLSQICSLTNPWPTQKIWLTPAFVVLYNSA